MSRNITVYNDDRTPVVTIKVDFESGSVTVQNGKGNSLVTLTSDNTIVEHAGYHVHISGGDSYSNNRLLHGVARADKQRGL